MGFEPGVKEWENDEWQWTWARSDESEVERLG